MNNIVKKDTSQNLAKQSIASPFSLIDKFFEDTWNPFSAMTPGFFRSSSLSTANTMFPKMDIEENEKEIIVTANVPGINAENINVEVGDDYLSLSGKVEKENKSEKGKVYRYEREYGEFRREFALPARVNKDQIIAKSKNGVLTITMPKIEDEQKKKVKIEVA